MAKLKCVSHKRRVVAVNGKFIHRNGFGDVCDSPEAGMMGDTFTAKGIQMFGFLRPPRNVK